MEVIRLNKEKVPGKASHGRFSTVGYSDVYNQTSYSIRQQVYWELDNVVYRPFRAILAWMEEDIKR